MGVITPTIERTGSYDGVPTVVWRGVTPSDTLAPFLVQGQYGFAGCVQISGTFGGATVSLLQSNDAVSWFPAYDPVGNLIETTSSAIYELSLAAAYFKPNFSGGVGFSVDIILVLRG
jgi:hypothetical protein